MQIRMTLHVPRRRPRPVELIVRWRRPEAVGVLRAALSDHLGEPVEALAVDGTDERLYVRGDAATAYGQIMEVMGALSAAGYGQIGLITERKEAE